MNIHEERDEEQSQIEVRVFANLREILGWKTLNLTVSAGISMREFINHMLTHISDQNSQTSFRSEILDEDQQHIKRYVKIMLNGQILYGDHALDTPIPSGFSVIAIFPPLGGG